MVLQWRLLFEVVLCMFFHVLTLSTWILCIGCPILRGPKHTSNQLKSFCKNPTPGHQRMPLFWLQTTKRMTELTLSFHSNWRSKKIANNLDNFRYTEMLWRKWNYGIGQNWEENGREKKEKRDVKRRKILERETIWKSNIWIETWVTKMFQGKVFQEEVVNIEA